MHKETICDEPLIFVIHGYLMPEECAAQIVLSEGAGYDDAPITTSRGFVMRKDIRDNLRVMVDNTGLALSLFERAQSFLPHPLGQYDLLELNERLRYYRYDIGQTFRPHYDGNFARNRTEGSFLTFMVYLNDDFTGGETIFYHDDEKIRASIIPQQGMALVFEHQQLHEGAPVQSGRKYVLRTDVMYKLH